MGSGDRAEDSSIVLRRFDPTDPGHYSLDEKTGQKRIRSGAFVFDDEPDYGGRGCSVFEEPVLRAHGADRLAVVEAARPHWAVAESDCKTVREVSRPTVAGNPFDVVQAPDSEEVPGVAHALVTHPPALAGASAWYRELALRFDADLPETA